MLKPYQKECINKFESLKVGAIFMGMGTGKTLTIAHIINNKHIRNKIGKVLYLTPKSLCETTKTLINSYEIELPPIRFEGVDSISMSDRLYLDLNDWVDEKTMIVIDESSWVKNPYAKRTKRVLNLSTKTQYKFILSGTPVSKTSADLFTQMFFLSPKILGYQKWSQFEYHHVEYDRRKGQKIIWRILNEHILIDKIKPVTFQKYDEIEIAKNYVAQQIWLDDEAHREYQTFKNEFLESIINLDYFNIFALFTKLMVIVATSKAKTDKVIDTIEDSGIIWTRFNKEQQIYRQYLDCELLNGTSNKNEAIEAWKNKGNILVANIQVGAFGNNFQHVNRMVFASNSFDWALREQAEKRIHRIGQTQPCCFIDVVAVNTIDEHVQGSLRKKTKLVDKVWNLCRNKSEEEKKQIVREYV